MCDTCTSARHRYPPQYGLTADPACAHLTGQALAAEIARASLQGTPASLRHLAADVAELTVGGVAPSTFRKYANGFEKYNDFCADAGIQAVPATAAGVAAFLSAQCKEY